MDDLTMEMPEITSEKIRSETGLSIRESIILRKRNEWGWTLEAVAKDHDLTRERIRQIEKEATKKLVDGGYEYITVLSERDWYMDGVD